MTTHSSRTQVEPSPEQLKLSLRGAGQAPSGLRSVPDPGLPAFETKQEEQRYLKERLAGAFRIFAMLGYDEGVAGHITVRDVIDPQSVSNPTP